MSESLFIAGILAVVGGFLDAYSYLLRGEVFANAQTGNIVLLGIFLQKKDFAAAAYYLVPIGAFAAGVILVELIKKKFKHQKGIHWRQRIVFLEVILLGIVGLIPLGDWNVIANVMISFVCAIQVETFRKVHGNAFASTMCTGNLRSGTESFFHYWKTKDRSYLEKALKYYGIIVLFILGAVIGGFLSGRAEGSSIFLCCLLLIIAGILMRQEFRN